MKKTGRKKKRSLGLTNEKKTYEKSGEALFHQYQSGENLNFSPRTI